jgi:carboxylesterase type B
MNIFGFPNSPALPLATGQNLGIRDQRIALEWLRDNIAAWGGDSERMLMGGQSAGADTAHSFVYSYPDNPIISGLALQSGLVQVIGPLTEDVDSEFVRVANTVGCANTNRSKELDCMKSVDAKSLKNAISNETFNLFGSPAGGGPMVDNATLFTLTEYLKRGGNGQFAKIVCLMSGETFTN